MTQNSRFRKTPLRTLGRSHRQTQYPPHPKVSSFPIPVSQAQSGLGRPNSQSGHHHTVQRTQPRPGQRPDRYTPNHRSKAHPLETQKTPSVRPGTNRGQKFAMPHSKTANTGSFWPITCVSWRGVVHALQRHSASCGRMWIGANNSSPSARTA
jgi:hypothetical protein